MAEHSGVAPPVLADTVPAVIMSLPICHLSIVHDQKEVNVRVRVS